MGLIAFFRMGYTMGIIIAVRYIRKWNGIFECAIKKDGHGNGEMTVKEKLIRFMQGRYGVYGPDLLNKTLLGSAMVLMVLSLFVRWRWIYWVMLAFLFYSYFRMFSKNCTKRYAENQAFMKHTAQIRVFFGQQKNMMRQRKTHHIYKCPNCGQKIRIPRGKGKIAVRCPKCSTEFIKKS